MPLALYLRQAGKPARGRGPLDGGGSSQQLPLQRRGVQTRVALTSIAHQPPGIKAFDLPLFSAEHVQSRPACWAILVCALSSDLAAQSPRGL